MKTETQEPGIRILKVDSCPSLTGKSTLTYHIGCNAESAIQLRVAINTGGGYFSKEWIAFSAVQQTLEQHPKDKPFTSRNLRSLFNGKSSNTPAFLMAALEHEGLVKTVDEKKRGYQWTDSGEFMTAVQKLIDSTVDLKIESKPNQAAPTKKAASKKT